MAFFDYSFDLPGHDKTLRQLDDIIQEYRKACYATGKRVNQPHLRETARKAIQSLSPFYSEGDIVFRVPTRHIMPRLGARNERPTQTPESERRPPFRG